MAPEGPLFSYASRKQTDRYRPQADISSTDAWAFLHEYVSVMFRIMGMQCTSGRQLRFWRAAARASRRAGPTHRSRYPRRSNLAPRDEPAGPGWRNSHGDYELRELHRRSARSFRFGPRPLQAAARNRMACASFVRFASDGPAARHRMGSVNVSTSPRRRPARASSDGGCQSVTFTGDRPRRHQPPWRARTSGPFAADGPLMSRPARAMSGTSRT